MPRFNRERCVNAGLDPDTYAAFKRFLAEKNVSIALSADREGLELHSAPLSSARRNLERQLDPSRASACCGSSITRRGPPPRPSVARLPRPRHYAASVRLSSRASSRLSCGCSFVVRERTRRACSPCCGSKRGSSRLARPSRAHCGRSSTSGSVPRSDFRGRRVPAWSARRSPIAFSSNKDGTRSSVASSSELG